MKKLDYIDLLTPSVLVNLAYILSIIFVRIDVKWVQFVFFMMLALLQFESKMVIDGGKKWADFKLRKWIIILNVISRVLMIWCVNNSIVGPLRLVFLVCAFILGGARLFADQREMVRLYKKVEGSRQSR